MDATLCPLSLGRASLDPLNTPLTSTVWLHCRALNDRRNPGPATFVRITLTFQSFALCGICGHKIILWLFRPHRIVEGTSGQRRTRLSSEAAGRSTSHMRVGGKLPKRFITTSGVRQGCTLFSVTINWIRSHLAPSVGVSVRTHLFTDLAHVDDAAVFLSDKAQVGKAPHNFSAASSFISMCLGRKQQYTTSARVHRRRPQLSATSKLSFRGHCQMPL